MNPEHVKWAAKAAADAWLMVGSTRRAVKQWCEDNGVAFSEDLLDAARDVMHDIVRQWAQEARRASK